MALRTIPWMMVGLDGPGQPTDVGSETDDDAVYPFNGQGQGEQPLFPSAK